MLDRFLQVFEVVDIESHIAKTGGLYRRDYGRNHGVGLADAIIAAAAQSIQAKLATLNVKHFPMIKDVQAPYQK